MSFRDLALRRISRRDCSTRELQTYLQRKGATESEASQIAASLAESGWIDDQRYQGAIVRVQGGRGKGPRAIAQQLARRGVPADVSVAREMLETAFDSTEEQLALKILERRYPAARTDREVRQKAMAALLRRGFSPSAVMASLRTFAESRAPDLESEL